MSLKLENFEVLDEEKTQILKTWDGDYELQGDKIPLEVLLTETQGNHKAFMVDVMQGSRKFLGDEFETAEEALKDAEFRIEELFDNYELETKDFGADGWDRADGF